MPLPVCAEHCRRLAARHHGGHLLQHARARESQHPGRLALRGVRRHGRVLHECTRRSAGSAQLDNPYERVRAPPALHAAPRQAPRRPAPGRISQAALPRPEQQTHEIRHNHDLNY